MKKAVWILATMFLVQAAEAQDINSHNTIIVKPVISEGCCKSKCKQHVKTIVKKEVVEKIVEKPVEKIVYVDRTVERIVIKKTHRKNRISLLGGVGPTKLDQPNPSEVNLIRGPVGGLQYQRSLTERVNVGIQVHTNQSVLGSVGFDF